VEWKRLMPPSKPTVSEHIRVCPMREESQLTERLLRCTPEPLKFPLP
jgi:hypothetical protein